MPFSRPFRLAVGVTFSLLASASLAASTENREIRRSVTLPALSDGATVQVKNLAGRIELETSEGRQLEVVAKVTARARSSEEARRLLSLLDVTVSEVQGGFAVKVLYPTDEYKTYRYSGVAKGLRLASRWGGVSTAVSYEGSDVTVTTAREGIELFADLRIRVPDGATVDVENGVGLVEGRRLASSLTAGTVWGDIRVDGGSGALRARTETGDVVVRGRNGTLDLMTDLGDVTLDGVEGPVSASTGAGDVKVKGASIRGDVSIESASGDVVLDAGARGVTGVEIRVGSGDATVSMSSLPPATVMAESGSGDVEVDAPGLKAGSDGGRFVETETGASGPRIPVRVESRSGTVKLRIR
jgi:DUF4097 and DUF4098 domain-containing protein YvlB